MKMRHEDGIAMLMAMAATLLMSALGIALVLTTSSEAIMSSNFRNASEAAYAADAALERSIDDLFRVPDWNTVLTGSAQSTFIDGAPSGTRTLADGSTIDLGQVVNMANCSKTAICSDADLDAVTPQRPWGTNNPRWQLYAYGNLSDMLPGHRIDSPYYVLVMVGDDPSETDGKPLQDGIDTPGAGVLALRAAALGPRGVRRMIEMTVIRTPAAGEGAGPTGGQILSWREIR
jgi:hypothetical protein